MLPAKKSKFQGKFRVSSNFLRGSTAEASGPSVAMPMDLHSSVRHLAINGQGKAIPGEVLNDLVEEFTILQVGQIGFPFRI